jgi:ABC-type amino acid transport substrate-binding protein
VQLHAQEHDLSPIRVVSEAWEGCTNADGTGLAWDILRKVYEPLGIQLQFEIVPYTRSVGLVQRGKADAWVGAYPDEVDNAIYPHWHYDRDSIYALGLRSSPRPTIANMDSFRLIWMRAYDYQNQLPNISLYQEVQRRDVVLDMLKSGRADFYLDDLPEVNGILKKSLEPQSFQLTLVHSLNNYFGFAPNERGRQLAELFDQRMAVLVQNDELKPIFQRWERAYPFDNESP